MGKIARQPQLLTISPGSELEFRGDPKEVNISSVRLRNDTAHRIGFKVMTNAPHLLFVSPTSDVIGPGDQSTIKVKLQPNSDGSDAASLKFLKLLIQSLVLRPEDGVEGVDKLISVKSNSSEVMETKMSCTFMEVYTSEIDFPLTSEAAEGHDLQASPSPSNNVDAETLPGETTSGYFPPALVMSIVVVLAAILVWYVYSCFFGDSLPDVDDSSAGGGDTNDGDDDD